MKKYSIIVVIVLMFVQLQAICMDQDIDMDVGKSWIIIPSDGVPPRYQRPQPPLPARLQSKIPEDTIKRFYKSIEHDKSAFQEIITNYPDIVHIYADYSSLTHNFAQVTPLYVAAREKNHAAVRLLLASGSDVNKGTAKGDSPLHKAGNKRIAKILVAEGHATIDHKNNDGITPVHEALFDFNKRLDVAHYLLKHGANINQVNGKEGNTLLHEAVSCFQADDAGTKTAFLIERGANLFLRNAQGKTAYQLILIDDFKLMKLFYPPKDRRTKTFEFFVSVIKPQDDIVIFEKTIDLLLDYKPDFSGIDADGNTLLHIAMSAHNRESIKFLVKHHLLPLTANKHGKTVLDWVYFLEDEECIKVFNGAVFEKFFVTPCYAPGYKALKAFLKYAFASKHKETFVRGILHCAAYPRAEIAYNQCLPLLKWGVPINLRSCAGDFPKQNDKYPYALSCAVTKWDVDLIHLFLDHGATVCKEMLEYECCYNGAEVRAVRERLKELYKKQ